MTTLSSDTETSSSSRISSQVFELEKELKALVKDKRAFHPEVRSVRNKLREKYVEIILSDPEACEKHDTPTSLWNWAYYIIIEEFRNRIRYIANDQSVPAANKTSRVLKLLTDLRNFIGDAIKFYSALIVKLKRKHGLQQEGFTFEGPEFESLLLDSKRSTEFRKTCHRFFINLGDLARYKELHSDGDSYAPDWKIPAEHYFKALSLWPASGHPHNQLAVLATYMQNDFLAVYHYFRSLGVDDPFITARGNLIILFDVNRQQYAEILEQKRPGEAQQKKGKAGKAGAKKTTGESIETEDEVKKTFFIRFVRLYGILFTKTSLETFPEVFTETFRDLEKVLSLDQERLESLFSTDLHKSEDASRGLSLGFLQLVSVMIFSVPSGSSRSSYADALQHTTIAKHAITASFRFAGCLMTKCANAENVAESPLLPASLVFMEWMASRPDVIAGSPTDDERQSNARAVFWKGSMELLNRICDMEDYESSLSSQVALWEDRELAGFMPLASAHAELDFNKEHSNEEGARLHRFVAAGKSIANVLDGSTAGLAFDDDMTTFYLGGEKRERRPKEKVYVTKAQVQTSVPVEEDEEEVIVFQPQVKVVLDSKLSSGENEPGACIPPTQNDLYGTAQQNGAPVATELKPDVPLGTFGLPTDIEFNQSFASMGMTSSSLPSYAPALAPSSSNYSLAPSSYSLAPSTYYGPSTSTGMNGQVSVAASLGTAGMESFESSFGTYASFAQDLLSKLSSTREQMRSTPLTDTTGTLPTEVEYMKALDQKRDAASSRMRPVVAPPPGFGPIPQRASSNQNLAVKGDSLWRQGFNSDPRPLFSTKPDIWSYGAGVQNGLFAPKSAAYPFPGMGLNAPQQLPMVQPVQGTWNPEPSSVPRPAPRPYRPPDYVS